MNSRLMVTTSTVQLLICWLLSAPSANAQGLTAEQASRFSELALHCTETEFPNKPGDVLSSASDLHPPRELHPAFYGCFDWHSSVHGHWMFVHLLRTQNTLELEVEDEIRDVLDRNLTRANLLREAAYFAEDNNRSFERMYGWAWLLKLSAELRAFDDDQARAWARALVPLEEIIVERAFDFLPVQTYPIRIGTHSNTAFGMSFAWDYAREAGQRQLQELIDRRARDYYLDDRDCPAAWEPGGADFLSPCLVEAELMARILEQGEFSSWLAGFLPELSQGGPRTLLEPAEVSDRSDPQIGHLDGLNLSRAWAMFRIADALDPADSRIGALRSAAERHLEATLPHVTSGHYEGEHWLASFAVWALANR